MAPRLPGKGAFWEELEVGGLFLAPSAGAGLCEGLRKLAKAPKSGV